MTEYDVGEVKTRLKGLSEALRDSEYRYQYRGIPTGLKRLTRLANHLKNGKMGHKIFDITHYHLVTRCESVGCALGECPAVFNEWRFTTLPTMAGPRDIPVLKTLDHRWNDTPVKTSAEKFFHISHDEVEHIFFANCQLPKFNWRDELTNEFQDQVTNELQDNATKEEVANNMLSFVLNRINIITGKLK